MRQIRLRDGVQCFLLLLILLLIGCAESDSVTNGRAIYARECASCHGANLEGQTNWKERNPDGTWRSPPHDNSGHTWHHDDAYIIDRITNGTANLDPKLQTESNMPAFGETLTAAEIDAVLTFIKSEWSAETRRVQAERNNP